MKFILNCLLLPTSEFREELVNKILEKSVQFRQRFPQNNIELVEIDKIKYHVDDKWPVLKLRTLLKMKGLEAGGNRNELIERLKSHECLSGELKFDEYTSYDEDRRIIKNVVAEIVNNVHRGNLTDKYKYIFKKYGYHYIEDLHNFIHLRTKEKLYGDFTWSDRISLFFYDLSWRETKFIDNEIESMLETAKIGLN